MNSIQYTNKIWYVIIDGKIEGPSSFAELKADNRITPDTLAWKEGFDNWVKIRDIFDLEKLFKDDPVPNETEEENDPDDLDGKVSQNELVLDMGQQEPPYVLWFLVAFISLMYVILKLYTK